MSKLEAVCDFPARLLSSTICTILEICCLTIDRDFIAQHKMILFHPIKYEKDIQRLKNVGDVLLGLASKAKRFSY